ncbi:MAG: hypothetical protein P8Y67_08135 [Alphaproteobacteria bacterium]
MHPSIKSLHKWAILLAAGCVLSSPHAQAKDFTYNENTNARIAKKLNIPVFFAVPARARAELSSDIKTTDQLIDFKHPAAKGADGDIGLRLIYGSRRGMAKRLAQSGLVKTGDILLSFRNEWGGAGSYPHVQMGISHSAVAYIKDGVVHNIDSPLSRTYIGKLDSKHYRELKFMHIIRPRNLTETDRENLVKWSTLLVKDSKSIYPNKFSFNSDYNDPKYRRHKRPGFVKKLGKIALGQKTTGNLSMYCSEFVWSLLSLRGCDPDTTQQAFQRKRIFLRRWNVPSCVKQPMQPMHATDTFVARKGRGNYIGLAEGPLMVIDAMNLPEAEREKTLHSVFVTKPGGLKKLSTGHRKVAKQMAPKFAPLETYYLGTSSSFGKRIKARTIGIMFNIQVPDNYSPTSYLINTLLPKNHKWRTMDYVATVVFR